MFKKVLVIAAHPDDEVLGCAGTIASFTKQGAIVHAVYLTDGISARSNEGNYDEKGVLLRREAAMMAAEILGISSIDFGNFPDNKMDFVPLLEVTQFIENKIFAFQPELVLTHHAGDLNVDHRVVNQATVTACRPQPGQSVHALLFFEVPSSTEWQISTAANAFIPNWFVDISDFLSLRDLALKAYETEIRPWPHSRSIAAMEALIKWRGASIGVAAAEAFMLGRYLQRIVACK